MSKKRQRPSPPKPVCVYCGAHPGVTKDHVIPKCLFSTMPVVGTITVPVYKECNERKAKDDTYLADTLQSHFLAQQHPVARSQAEGRFLRSVAKHSSDFAEALVEQYVPLLAADPNALPDDGLTEITVDPTRLTHVLQLITRGLYAHYLKSKRLPPDCFIGVKRVSEEEMVKLLPRLTSVTIHGLHRIGEDVVIVRYSISQSNPVESLWLIVFYQSIVFTVLTSMGKPSAH